MANLKNPFDDLTTANGGVAPSDSGAWTTDLTTGAPPLPPAEPAAYNDDIDFEGVDPGVYPYTYTVASCDGDIEATVTYTLTPLLPVVNDNCAGARPLVFPYQGGTSKLTEQSLAGSCPGMADPTYQAIATPTAWGTGTFTSDVWFVLSFDSTYPVPPIVVVTIDIDGTPYGSEGVFEPHMAAYTNCSNALVSADVPTPNTSLCSLVYSSIFSTDFTYYIRVACKAGNEGKFDINVTV